MASALSRRIRNLREHPEAGFTLIEMVMVFLLLGLILGAFTTVLVSVQASLKKESDRSVANDQARLAVEQLDRQIRSGNLLYDPRSENDVAHGIYPGMSLRIYTQNNATTHTPGNRCVQWRIQNSQLQTRDWSPAWRDDDIVDPWRVVAQNIVNQTVSPQVPAFVLDPDLTKGSRTMQITILANANPKSGQNVKIQESITGRNTEYGYPSSVCSDIPPY